MIRRFQVWLLIRLLWRFEPIVLEAVQHACQTLIDAKRKLAGLK